MNVICVCVYCSIAKWKVTQCSTLLSHVSTKRLTVYTWGTTGQTIVHCGQLFQVDMSPGTQSPSCPSIWMFSYLFSFCPFLSTHPFVYLLVCMLVDSSFFLSVHRYTCVPIISHSVLIWCKICLLYWPITIPRLWSVTSETFQSKHDKCQSRWNLWMGKNSYVTKSTVQN